MDVIQQDIKNHWEFLVALFGIIGAVLTVYFNKVHRDTTKLVESEKQREITQTENRRLLRDKQLADMKHDLQTADAMISKRLDDVAKIADGVGKSLDRHIDYYKERDIKIEALMQNVSDKIAALEKNSIERREISEIYTKVNELSSSYIKIETTLQHIKEQLERTMGG